ncbi:hypothetical protein F5Y15DRAFT_410795 [Xylariaceae sp. FL0016]|nr:hypothetical protein F5Y15DRAFT_410795 [Xylariaceae sp. FL0016]
MADDAPAQPVVAQPAEAAPTSTTEAAAPESVAPAADAKPKDSEPATTGAAEVASTTDTVGASGENVSAATIETKPQTGSTDSNEAPATADEKSTEIDVEMKDNSAEGAAEPSTESNVEVKPAETTSAATAADEQDVPPASDGNAVETENATPSGDKSKGRRKSTGVAAAGKKLNKKASKAKILHLDAKPGDYFFAQLKGFPPWPVIVAEEDMLPPTLVRTRPVTAARPDGTYREDFADGGKRIADRTFPVMYLHTNEFSWARNTDLVDLDLDTVMNLIQPKMRKDLQAAHLLASEKNDLNYFKSILRDFEEQRQAKEEAKKAKEAAKKTPKKASKTSAAAAADDDEGDIEMADAEEDDAAEPAEKKNKNKKRKAEDESNTSQRSDSVKKPKIKLTNISTPGGANGTQSPSSGKDSTKPAKAKGKSAKGAKEPEGKKEKETAAPKEPEMTAEERHVRKEKEILFLRHRLQKGLLLRDQAPKAEEMQSMSEFLAKLETFPDLEVSIIRVTKINKVLKAILKLETIPREDEFKFKPRSQALLDKWNALLAVEGSAPAPVTNGVNGTSSTAAKSEKEATNGVKEEVKEETKVELENEAMKTENPEKEVENEAEAKVATATEEQPIAPEV